MRKNDNEQCNDDREIPDARKRPVPPLARAVVKLTGKLLQSVRKCRDAPQVCAAVARAGEAAATKRSRSASDLIDLLSVLGNCNLRFENFSHQKNIFSGSENVQLTFIGRTACSIVRRGGTAMLAIDDVMKFFQQNKNTAEVASSPSRILR